MTEASSKCTSARPPSLFWIAVLTAIFIAAVDLATKWTVATALMDPPRTIEITSFFRLNLGFNRGISFGMLSGLGSWGPPLLSITAGVMITVLLIWLRRVRHHGEAMAVAAITGGAASNLIDRLHDGAVTDFLDFSLGTLHWPAFNLADTAIVLGVVGVLFGSLRQSGS